MSNTNLPDHTKMAPREEVLEKILSDSEIKKLFETSDSPELGISINDPSSSKSCYYRLCLKNPDEPVRLPLPESLKDKELSIMIYDINKDPKKYSYCFDIPKSYLSGNMEKEELPGFLFNCNQNINPYLKEARLRPSFLK